MAQAVGFWDPDMVFAKASMLTIFYVKEKVDFTYSNYTNNIKHLLNAYHVPHML